MGGFLTLTVSDFDRFRKLKLDHFRIQWPLDRLGQQNTRR